MNDCGKLLAAATAALMLVLGTGAATAAGDHEGGHDQAQQGEGHDHGGHAHGGGQDFAFGRAAPGASPDRTVEIVARDTMSYDPATVAVESGEVVRFVVRNKGQLRHSFTLGSPRYQRRHEQEMQDMAAAEIAGHMQDNPNGVVVAPGGTKTLTWRFERGGPVQFACHIPGHFQAGMKGRIRLRPSVAETSGDSAGAS